MTEKKTPEIRFKGFTGDWEQRKLELLASFSKGNGYSKADLANNGDPIILYGKLYTRYEAVISNVDTFVEPKENSVRSIGGEVIVPASGENAEDIARAAVVDIPNVILGGDLNIITPNNEINSNFLALTISNGEQRKELSKRAQGKSVVHIRNTDLKNIELIFPSFEEQTKIGSFFKQLDDTIALHQRKLELLQQTKKGFLQKIFPPQGESHPQLRFKEFSEPWELRKLGEITESFDEKRIPIDSGLRVSGTYPYYGATGIIDYVNDYIFDGEYVLLAEDGANIIMRNYPVAYLAKGRFWLNNHAHVMKMIDGDNYFLVQMLEKIDYVKYNTGTAQPKLNGKIIKSIDFRLPGFKEQIKIGTFFKQLDTTIVLYQNKIEMLKQIKTAYLNDMFI